MKRCSLFCAGWWPFIVFPLLILLPLLFFKWHAIEADVASNALAKLKEADIDWANVETFNDGRDALITGVAPSLEAAKRAETIAAQAEGVRVARFHDIEGSIAAPPPPESPSLNALVTGESLVLRGTLANQADIDRVMTRAQAAFGSDNVFNKLDIGRNIAELPDTSGLFEALVGQGDLGTVSAAFANNTLSISGEVINQDAKESLNKALGGIFGGEIDDRLAVATPVERDTCEDLVNELLTSGNINFESGKDTIAEESHELLESIASIAKRCPEAAFEVAGHTDGTGNLAFNVSLSERRAAAVVKHLEGLGLDTTQFSSVGYGPNQPIASNDTAEGRAQNRRIEFKLKN